MCLGDVVNMYLSIYKSVSTHVFITTLVDAEQAMLECDKSVKKIYIIANMA